MCAPSLQSPRPLPRRRLTVAFLAGQHLEVLTCGFFSGLLQNTAQSTSLYGPRNRFSVVSFARAFTAERRPPSNICPRFLVCSLTRRRNQLVCMHPSDFVPFGQPPISILALQPARAIWRMNRNLLLKLTRLGGSRGYVFTFFFAANGSA